MYINASRLGRAVKPLLLCLLVSAWMFATAASAQEGTAEVEQSLVRCASLQIKAKNNSLLTVQELGDLLKCSALSDVCAANDALCQAAVPPRSPTNDPMGGIGSDWGNLFNT